MNSSNNKSSLVDGVIRFEPGRLVVDQAILEGALDRYITEGKPILDDRDVMRLRAQSVLAKSESLVHEARLHRYVDMRALVSIEEMGVKFPLTNSDRVIGLMKDGDFENLMAKTDTRRQECNDLDTKLGAVLLQENYFRTRRNGADMPKGRLFTPFERERTASNIVEIAHPKMWLEINGLGVKPTRPEEEGRREAVSRLALIRYHYEQNILESFSYYRIFNKADETLTARFAMNMESLQTNLSMRVSNANGFRNAAHRIANPESYRRNWPSWEEKPVAAPLFTPSELGRMAEYALAAEGDNRQSQYIHDSYRGAGILQYESASKSASHTLDVHKGGRPEPREGIVLER